jgi:hypothetical protein
MAVVAGSGRRTTITIIATTNPTTTATATAAMSARMRCRLRRSVLLDLRTMSQQSR